jgi:hypothetical protein
MNNITIESYSEKAIKISGDTKPVKDLLKQAGAKFNPYLQGGPGWIASKSKHDLILQLIESGAMPAPVQDPPQATNKPTSLPEPIILNEVKPTPLDIQVPEPSVKPSTPPPPPAKTKPAATKPGKTPAFTIKDLTRVLPISKAVVPVHITNDCISYFADCKGVTNYGGVIQWKHGQNYNLSNPVSVDFAHLKDNGLPVKIENGFMYFASGAKASYTDIEDSDVLEVFTDPEKGYDIETYLHTLAPMPQDFYSRFKDFLSDDELRPVMNGAYFDTNKKVAATDANRLVALDCFAGNIKDSKGVILVRAVCELLKFSSVKVYRQTQTTGKVTNALRHYTELPDIGLTLSQEAEIDGIYPKYEVVIPKVENMTAKVTISDKKLFLSMIKNAEKAANKTSKVVKLTYSDGCLHVESNDIDFGTEYTGTIQATYSGTDAFQIGFNSKFLYECINSMPDNEVIIQMSAPNRPALLGNDANVLLMPVIITE